MKKLLALCLVLTALQLEAQTTPFTAVGDPVATGASPVFIAYSNNGRFAATPNFNDNTVSVYEVDCENGLFTPIQTVETGSFPISFDYSPCDNHAVVTNSDSPALTAAGENGTLAVYHVNCTTGEWSLIQTISDPNVPFSVAYSPDGRFVAVADYTSSVNGLGSRTVIYRVSPSSGKLLFVDEIINDRGQLVVDWAPNGKFLAVANFDDNSVSVFSVDPDTGVLTEIAGSPFLTGGSGSQEVIYQHDGNFAAVTNFNSGNLTVFEVNQITGAFTNSQLIPTTPANSLPTYIAFSKDDTLAAVSSDASPGSVLIFCVTDGIWCLAPIQTLPPADRPLSLDFAPCSDFAVVAIRNGNEDPSTLQVYQVTDEPCPDCTL